MYIHHIALYVNDLEKMKNFYCYYFQATSNEQYHNPKTGLQTYFLSFEQGCKLEIMARPDIQNRIKNQFDSGYIHLAVKVGSTIVVDTLTHQLQSDGYTVLSQPRTTGDGYYESCILDPENNQVEIIA